MLCKSEQYFGKYFFKLEKKRKGGKGKGEFHCVLRTISITGIIKLVKRISLKRKISCFPWFMLINIEYRKAQFTWARLLFWYLIISTVFVLLRKTSFFFNLNFYWLWVQSFTYQSIRPVSAKEGKRQGGWGMKTWGSGMPEASLCC